MKKTIIFNNGETKVMECNEKFLDLFRALGFKIAKGYKKGAQLTEDEIQEIDITIFESFLSYDEEHCFTTHLTNQLRGLFANKINKLKTGKRDTTDLKIISLDLSLSDGSGDKESELHETITDETINISGNLLEREFLNFVMSNLDGFELDMLAFNLKRMKQKEICEKYSLKKSAVSNRNQKFKQKLKKLIEKYNK